MNDQGAVAAPPKRTNNSKGDDLHLVFFPDLLPLLRSKAREDFDGSKASQIYSQRINK